jgi:hypothetical protein
MRSSSIAASRRVALLASRAALAQATGYRAASPAASINGALLAFFSEVHDKTGYARPATINGFPPGPL